MWYSPCGLYFKKPPASKPWLLRHAFLWKRFKSPSNSAKPAPLMRLTMPLKHKSATSLPMPTNSNKRAQRYEEMVEIPIFDMILYRPLLMPLRKLAVTTRKGLDIAPRDTIFAKDS